MKISLHDSHSDNLTNPVPVKGKAIKSIKHI